MKVERITRTEAGWRSLLTLEQYRVARQGGTERAFTGAYWETKTPGIYVCVCCGLPLFDSDDKLDSGSGWPSYSDVIDPEHVETRADDSLGMGRVAVRAATRTAVTFSRTDRHPRESATA